MQGCVRCARDVASTEKAVHWRHLLEIVLQNLNLNILFKYRSRFAKGLDIEEFCFDLRAICNYI